MLVARNWPVLAAVMVLSLIGILSIYADNPEDGAKQVKFFAVGTVALFALQLASYTVLGRFSLAIYAGAMLLILYTVLGAAIGGKNPLPLVSPSNDAYAWIKIGSFSLQPAELMKIGFVLTLARYLRFRSNYRTLKGLVPPFLLCFVPVAMILKQPDLGTALTFIPALFAMLYVAGAKAKHLLLVVALGVASMPFLWYSGHHVIKKTGYPDQTCAVCPNLPVLKYFPQFVKHYQRERVYAMVRSDQKTLQVTGYQVQRSMSAFGSGGIFGKGLGNIPVGKRVPEAHNDMIFGLVGEQFGFVGVAVVLISYLILFAAGVEISSATRDPFGRLIALGITTLLAGQTFMNLAVATKLMPVTGVTLPFISYGGSSLLASYLAIGLLLNVGQHRPIIMAADAFEY